VTTVQGLLEDRLGAEGMGYSPHTPSAQERESVGN
jgi:hypothetical protein